MKNYIEQLRDLESLKSTYKYQYVSSIVLDVGLNERYGDSREGYENFFQELRSNNDELTVSFAGVDSLRRVHNYKTNETIGYVVETKINNQLESYNKSSEILNKATAELKEVLKVTDNYAFDVWLEDYISDAYFDFDKSKPSVVINIVKRYQGIIKRYHAEEDFKKMLDKIKN